MSDAQENQAPDSDIKVTSAAEFRQRRQTFEQGEVLVLDSGFTVRVKRPSITLMVQSGRIPAALASSALRFDTGRKINDIDAKRLYELKVIVTKAALVSPKVVEANPQDDEIVIEDLNETDIDNIYMYTQGGMEVLNKFRKERQRLSDGQDSDSVSGDEA